MWGGEKGREKGEAGERGNPACLHPQAQGQPGLDGEGHVGSQGRRGGLEQGPTHTCGMLACLK